MRMTQENKTRLLKQQHGWREDRKVVCPSCSLIIRDCEPYSRHVDFYHEHTGSCDRDGDSLVSSYTKTSKHGHTVQTDRWRKRKPNEPKRAVLFRSKKDRRNRKRVTKRYRP